MRVDAVRAPPAASVREVDPCPSGFFTWAEAATERVVAAGAADAVATPSAVTDAAATAAAARGRPGRRRMYVLLIDGDARGARILTWAQLPSGGFPGTTPERARARRSALLPAVLGRCRRSRRREACQRSRLGLGLRHRARPGRERD